MAQGSPKWVWIFTPLVALSFAGFLLYLTTVPAEDDIDKITESLEEKAKQVQKDVSQQAKSLANDAVKQVIKQSLPEDAANNDSVNQTVDNFEFFEILENKEVDVEEVQEYKSTPKGYDKDGNKIQYRLRTGSFSTPEGADRQKAQLLLNGFNIQIVPADVNGRTWYRVFTGPYANRSQMNKAQDQLVSMGIQSVEITETLASAKP